MNNQEYFTKLLYNSSFAWWQWNIAPNEVIFNDLKVTMLGYDPADFVNAGYQRFTELLHPDDYEKAMNAMLRVLRRETDLYQIDYRILSKHSVYHWYMDRGTVIESDEKGNPSKLRGIVVDLGKESACGSSVDAVISLIENSAAVSNDYMFTVCSNCGKAKIENFKWITITDELKINLSSRLSHGLCPDCIRKLYPEFAEQILAKI